MSTKTLVRSMSIFTILACLLFLSQLANGQSKKDVSVEYDRFKDMTTIDCPLEKIGRNVYLSLAVIYHGKDKVKDPLFSFEVIVTQPIRESEFSHKTFKTVYFIMDGDKRFNIELYKYIPEVLSSVITETARMHLTEDEFNQIVTAKKLETQWGNTEFEVDKKTLTDFTKVKELYDARK